MGSTFSSFAPAVLFPSLARTAWKHLGLVAAAALTCTAIAVLTAFLLPPSYRSEALVLIDPQKIPETYVSSTVNSEVQDRLATISQEILSATKLQKIIDDFQLYRREKKHMYPEEILALMRKNIEIRLEKGWTRERPGAFRVGFEGEDPATVADVANRIVSLFLEENLREREVSAEGTSDFLTSQLEQARKKLEEQEQHLSQFKAQHAGQLPQEAGVLTGSLTRLQAQLQGDFDALSRAQQSKLMLESALRIAESSEAARVQAMARSEESPSSEKGPSVVKQLEERLHAMQLRYSDEHPDIQFLRAEIARLQRREQEDKREHVKSGGKGQPVRPEALQAEIQAQERIGAIRAQIEGADREIAARERDQEQLGQRIRELEARMQKLPVNELQMASISRDYENSLTAYKSLLEKKHTAEMASDLEHRQKGESFKVLDPARVPQKPLGPHRWLISFGGVALGLLLGAAGAFLIEFRRNVLLGEWELPDGVNVLGRIPFIAADAESQPDRLRSRALRTAAVSAVLLLALLLPGFYFLVRG